MYCRLRLGPAGSADLLPSRHDGCDDSSVTGTPTNVAAELASDGFSIRLSYTQQNIASHHQHTGGAKSTLQGMALVKMPSQDFHYRIVVQAFESLHGATIAHDRKSQTRAGSFSVHRDRA